MVYLKALDNAVYRIPVKDNEGVYWMNHDMSSLTCLGSAGQPDSIVSWRTRLKTAILKEKKVNWIQKFILILNFLIWMTINVPQFHPRSAMNVLPQLLFCPQRKLVKIWRRRVLRKSKSILEKAAETSKDGKVDHHDAVDIDCDSDACFPQKNNESLRN